MQTSHCRPLERGTPLPGETIDGKYLVDGLGGRRGPVIILRATRLPLSERVAIEVLQPAWASHDIFVERFMREAEAAMRVRSEHAVRILDEGQLESGLPYVVLEQVRGQSLQDFVSTWGRQPVPVAVDWVLQASEAVAQAHSYGLVHGDLTPAAMFLSSRPGGSKCIKVDFGTSRMSKAGAPGTGEVLVRRDVRALGAVLHVLLTGKPAHGEDLALPSGVPRSLELALRRCLEERSQAPFHGVAELARALAPFGTPAARVSRERVECLLEDRVSPLTRPKVRLDPVAHPPESPRMDGLGGRAAGAPASARVVLAGLAMLAALGVAAFATMYMSVPRGEPSSLGVAAMQPTAAVRAAAQTTVPPLQASAPDGGE
jgi:hypothetical protein